MPKIKNVSPFGDLDVPLLGRIVKAGEAVDVSDAHADILLQQEINFQPVTKAAKEAPKEDAK